jgi:predicted transposase YdaD
MRESATYQEIVQEGRQERRQEGRIEEARSALRRLAIKQFGPPQPRDIASLEGINNLQQLDELFDRVLDGSLKTWSELLTAQRDK